jgi:hypothetical protein
VFPFFFFSHRPLRTALADEPNSPGTQCTCSTSTRVQILTPEELRARANSVAKVLAYEEASGEDDDEKKCVLACEQTAGDAPRVECVLACEQTASRGAALFEQTAGDAPRVERSGFAGEAQRSSKLVVLKYYKSQISGTKVLQISGPLVLAYEETVGSGQKTRTLPRSCAPVPLLY